MKTFWNSRAPRERILLLAAGILLGLIIIQFLVIAPLRSANTTARTNLETASRQLDTMSSQLAVHAPQLAEQKSANGSAQDLRTSLLQLAKAQGLAVSRLQSGEDGRLILHFDAVAPTLIYAWLAEVEQSYGAVPDRASLFAEEDGRVRASFEFTGAAS